MRRRQPTAEEIEGMAMAMVQDGHAIDMPSARAILRNPASWPKDDDAPVGSGIEVF